MWQTCSLHGWCRRAMSEHRPIIITSKIRPHELFLFAAQIVLGVGYLVTVPAPASLASLVPSWLVHVWAAGMLISGLAGMAATFLPYSVRMLDLERGALLMSTGSLALIGGASLIVNGWRAFFAVAMIGFWAGANVARIVQIRRDAAQLKAAADA